jgi:hypothetical protein
MEALIRHRNVRAIEFSKDANKRYRAVIVIHEQGEDKHNKKHWYRLTLLPVRFSLDNFCLERVKDKTTISALKGLNFESYHIVFNEALNVFLKIKYFWDMDSLKLYVEISCI